jgi:hypothetical protein
MSVIRETRRLVRGSIGPTTLLTGLWAAAQVAYWIAGVRFDTSTRNGFWQFLDPAFLRASPIKSLVYLHAQPPLFNAFLWMAESISPLGLHFTAHAVFLALGLGLALGSASLARELGVGVGGSVAIGLAVSCNPSTVLYQNWLYPTFPIAVTLVLSALALARFDRTRAPAMLGLFLGGCAVLVYLRSVFHPVWFLGLVGVVGWWAARRIGARRTVVVAALPMLLVVGLSAKNMILFGDPGTSSWLGMSLAKATTFSLPRGQLRQLEREGVVDRVAEVTPFVAFPYYAQAGVPEAPSHDEVSVDRQFNNDGSPNLNYWGYIEASRRALADDIAVIERRPGFYLGRVGFAWEYYLSSPSGYGYLVANESKIAGIDHAWRIIAYGERPESFGLARWTVNGASIGIVTIAVLMVLLLAAFAALLGLPRRLRPLVRRPVVVFGTTTCLGFALVANATELGENMRFRYEVEPLQFVLVISLIVGTIAAFSSSAMKRERDGGARLAGTGDDANVDGSMSTSQ